MRREATGHYEVTSATGKIVPSFVPVPLLLCSAGLSLNGLDGSDQATKVFHGGNAECLSGRCLR